MIDPALNDLAQLTRALYQAELAKMQELNRQESTLRRDLIQLEDRRRTNMALPATQLNGVRQIGADLLWQGWVGRTRAGLQTQLAQVLARKGQMMKALRRTHGKKQAAAKMLQAAEQAQSKHRQNLRQQTEDGLMLIKSCKDRQNWG